MKLQLVNMKAKNHMGHTGVDEWTILKQILNKLGARTTPNTWHLHLAHKTAQ
jgi:hypothetical protein